MITIEKLKIYEYNLGDFDHATKKHMDILGNDVSLIESLIQDIRLMQKGLVSKEYAAGVNEKILQHCDNGAAMDYLKSIATTSDI
jgi:hypothetical protein